MKIEGENCDFGGSSVTGKLTFTVYSSGKGRTRQIGPFGGKHYSGGEAFIITDLDTLQLAKDQMGRYLGPIKSQTIHSGNYTLNHGLASAADADKVFESALASCNTDNPYNDEEVPLLSKTLKPYKI